MKKILILTILLLITGAGCFSSSTKKTNAPAPTEATTTTAEKTKIKTIAKTPAEKFCQDKNFELIIRYDLETQSGKAFCRFPNTEECTAEDFFNGICDSQTGARQYFPETATTTTSICTNNDPPVCGIDGRTYMNHCSAEREKILIKHTGSCSSPITITPADSIKLPSTTAANNETPATPTTPTNPATKPTNSETINLTWLEVVKEIITAQAPKEPPAFIKKCTGGQTFYYLSEGCKNCFSALYNESGSIVCYPNNDFGHTCPATFNQNNCTTIWKDNR